MTERNADQPLQGARTVEAEASEEHAAPWQDAASAGAQRRLQEAMDRIRRQLNLENTRLDLVKASEDRAGKPIGPGAGEKVGVSPALPGLAELRAEIDSVPPAISNFDNWRNQVGQLNPRRPGIHNSFIQFFKRVMRRLLSWLIRPLNHTDLALSEVLWKMSAIVQETQEVVGSIVQLQRQQQAVADGAMQALRAEAVAARQEDAARIAADRQLTNALLQTVQDLNSRIAESEAVKHSVSSLRREFAAASVDARVEALRSAEARDGLKAAEGLWFNDPIQIAYDESGKPQWSSTSEQIVERTWIYRQLASLPAGLRILDMGCGDSTLPIELASSGYSVTGVAARPYKLEHPNFRFLQGDIVDTDVGRNFDAVVALSMLDRVGLGGRRDAREADMELESAIARVREVLTPGGMFLLSAAYGIAAVTPQQRIFDGSELRRLLSGFAIQTAQYAVRVNRRVWMAPVDESNAASRPYDPSTYSPGALALLACRKIPGV